MVKNTVTKTRNNDVKTSINQNCVNRFSKILNYIRPMLFKSYLSFETLN